MDKESAMSPAAQVRHIHQGRRRREPQTASSPAVVLPNPYKAHPGLRRNHSGGSPTQRFANNELRSHGYSGNRLIRENNNNSSLTKNESTWDPQTKLKSTRHSDIPGHRRKHLHKMGQGLSESVPFEVKMNDFPELTGVFVDQTDSPHVQKYWGHQAPNLEDNSELARKPNHQGPSMKFGPKKTDAKFVPPEITLGESSEACDSSPSSLTSSWAAIASQPPKKPISKETLKPAQVAEVDLQEEGAVGKKKRKKKKKKAKGIDEDTEPGPTAYYQEPPKFEDEDEFPGLMPAFVGTHKLMSRGYTTNLCNEENQRQRIQQPADQKNDKTLGAKSPSTETMKAQFQKAEKISGKKSKLPVQLDIGNMLAVLEKKQSQKTKQDTKPLTLSVGGGLPVVPKQQPVQKKPWLQGNVAHNPLDSTSPPVKKGKQREVPKAKKPTALKKVILKEREERKQRRLLVEKGLLPEDEFKPAEEPSEEDNCEINALDDEMSSPINELDELDDQPEMNGTTNREREEEEQVEQTTTITTPVNQPKIHSRKFRDYCTQMLSKDVDECVTELLKELVRFQDRLYQKDPMKARMKRRIVMGLREVLKHLKLRKVKCVIISPNCERIQSKGGLDETLQTIIRTCREQGVPFVFALSRKALGRCVNKAVPVSLVGIFNFDGAQDIYHKMIELSSEARKAYEALIFSLDQSEESEPAADVAQMHTEEPEYIKLWKKVLEKESNHKCVNFEEQLSSMHLSSECTEHSNDEEDMS